MDMAPEWDRNSSAASDVFETIGNTPLVELTNASDGLDGTIYAKWESFNPSNSLKDRVYYEMITQAEKRGDLTDDKEILETSTGNAGIACTFVGTRLGYDVNIVMPEGMSEERKKLIRVYGGNLIETPGAESDVDLAQDKAEEMIEENPGKYWFPDQFSNADNIAAHKKTTGPEITDQLGGAPDAVVHGQGTGGTITGIARHIEEEYGEDATEIYPLEPYEAPLLAEGEWGAHEIEGIGDGFIPKNLDPSLFEGIVRVESEEALEMADWYPKNEGIFAGISSGANLAGAKKVLEQRDDVDNVVTVVCDVGERYFSTRLFEEDYEVEVPDRDHPIDERSKKLLDEYQDGWVMIE
jgi:cysteine synthase A